MHLTVPGLFVTGTDTGVGKTVIACAIARQLRKEGVNAGAYKPACSGVVVRDGAQVWEDIEELHNALNGAFERERICPQCFTAPLAPPVAAQLEGRTVDAALLRDGARWWNTQCEYLIVEGAGGLLCPLTATESIADLAGDLRLPMLIVARATLGTINHTLLTIEVARARNLSIAGIVLNDVDGSAEPNVAHQNAYEISKRSGVEVLAIVEHGQRVESIGQALLSTALQDGRKLQQ